MSSLGDPVSGLYCERLDASFWAEPANALTNAAFLVAAVAVLVRRRDDPPVLLLAAVTFAIGIGSFLFHTVATRWALIADVAPIQLFIAAYFFLALRRFFGIGAVAAGLATAAFILAASQLPRLAPDGPWRGFAGYLGGLLGLLGVGGALRLMPDRISRDAGAALLAIAALFAVSLGFRTIDGAVCPYVSTGAHPLWHLANSAVLFLLMETLAKRRLKGESGS